MDLELPYKTEYAKSGRASCKMCKSSIPQGTLRLAAMVQSAFHDGKQPMWFHEDCFFKKQRPQTVGDIENFENIRFEDQKRLRLKVGKHLHTIVKLIVIFCHDEKLALHYGHKSFALMFKGVDLI